MDDRLQPGTRVGTSLVVERFVGAGGMGTVYLAHDELLDRLVAVKLLRAGADDGVEGAALRTLLEARAAARVVHPHVVAVHTIGDHAGRPYIEMEWVQGGSLRARLEPAERPDRLTCARWLAQLAAALGHAHDLGVVHCDVKPENVLLRPQLAGPPLVKLADFGLARSRADGTEARAQSQGTLAYLAPELATEAPGPKSDQFALALVAAELLCGPQPARARWTLPPRLDAPADLPAGAVLALLRGLDADPRVRFSNVAAFADTLLRGLGMAHARGPLVGVTADEPADAAATSSELPVPALGAMLDDLLPADQVLAALAVLPPGYPGALRATLGAEPPLEVLLALRDGGLVDGQFDEWRVTSPVAREAILARLHRRQRRLLCARAAAALEACGPKREAVRADATGLYVAARRLGDAARLAVESAAAAKTARQKDHHLARAVSFLSTPVQPVPWAGALLQRCEWALQCGWLELARATLADTHGVLDASGLDRLHPLRVRAVLAAAELRGRSGDLQGAAQMLQQAVATSVPATEAAWLAPRLHARLVGALNRLGRRAEALHQGECALKALAGPGWPHHLDSWRAGLAWLHAACGTTALRTGDIATAERHFQRDLAMNRELGDLRHTAGALVSLGNVRFESGQLAAAEALYQQAAALLAPLGTLELTGIIDANLGDCWLRSGKPFKALRALHRAQAQFAEHGIGVHEAEVLRLLATACHAVGDLEGAAECRDAQAALAARRGQPKAEVRAR